MQRESVIFGEYLMENDSKRANLGLRSWLGGMFGCQHKEMSRPFSRQGETYRVCLGCGARREFIQSTWEMRGPFYFSDVQTAEVSPIKALKRVPRPKLVKTAAGAA